jgi:diaminopropionate ammonia-lyase
VRGVGRWPEPRVVAVGTGAVPSRLLLNPRRASSTAAGATTADPSARSSTADAGPTASLSPDAGVRDFHRRLPGYAPSPLHDLPELAAAVGVGRVLVKAEVERMGLPSFKVLGASWATYRLLCQEMVAAGVLGPDSPGGDGAEVEPVWSTVDDLANLVSTHLGPLRLVAATDGNHGRAVARMARWCGLAATILVPEGTAAARIDGIASEGAEVVVALGTYDDAVAASAAFAAGDEAARLDALAVVNAAGDGVGPAERRLAVSDTSWAGYEEVPRWVIDGYSTIFAELDEQLPELGIDRLDLAVVPLGVGALGAAAATSLKQPGAHGTVDRRGMQLVGVEPDTADCVAAAVAAGKLVEVPGPHRSIMVGLNCGFASPVALPVVAAGFDAFVAVDDDRCRAAIRSLAAAGLDVGETGAASLAALTALVDDHSTQLPLSPQATVLLLATEGVTDPANFQTIVGRPPG